MSSLDFPMKPHVSKSLVSHLEQVFRVGITDDILTMTDRELGRLVGLKQVINYLQALHTQQEEDGIFNVYQDAQDPEG